MLTYNIDEVTQFFKMLKTAKNAVFSCSFMVPDGSTVVSGFGSFHVTVNDLLGDVLRSAESLGAGDITLHTTLNQTNGCGRKAKDIIAPRVICLDLDKEDDGIVEEIITKYKPHYIVESSTKKHHIYWRISGALPLDRWSLYQLGLAWKFNGDKAMSQVTTMIRVPGFMRQCKDGKSFLPKCIYNGIDEKQGKGFELTEKGLMAIFPSVAKWGEEGGKELKAERKKIGLLAREIWKTKNFGDGFGAAGSAGCEAFKKMPEAGRNASLYFAIKNETYRKDLNYEEALFLGQELNNSFTKPLDETELRVVVKKAHAKGSEGAERRKEKDRKAVDLLTVDESDVSDALITKSSVVWTLPEVPPDERRKLLIQDVLNVAEKKVEESEKNLNFSERGIDTVIDPSIAQETENLAHKGGIGSNGIPTSFTAAAKKLGENILKTKQDAASGFAYSFGHATYMDLAQYLCKYWKTIGTFRKEGMSVFLKSTTKWGSYILKSSAIGKEVAHSMLCQTVSSVATACVNDSETKKTLEKIPNQHQLNSSASATWGLAQTIGTEVRQPGNIIVFQNGVFNLETMMFEEDLLAPLKHSHAIYAKWNKELARMIYEGQIWSSLCPVTAKYMQDWFPDDAGIAKVLLRFMGYCMTTDYSRQKFAFFYGPTRAGKGSLARLICWIVGDENYSSADYNILDGNFKTSLIHDKLVVTLEEVEGTPTEHEKRMSYLKKLMGGEKIMFERKYQQPFQDDVIGKFILQSNEPPKYQDKGHSVRARMISVGFEQSFEENTGIDPALEILKAEADKVATLAAMSWGVGRKELNPFLVEGSQALEVGRRELEDSMDIVGSTLKQYIKYDINGRIKSSALIDLVKMVADLKEIEFTKRPELIIKQEMHKLFPKSHYSNRLSFDEKKGRGYTGVTLDILQTVDDFPEIEDNLEKFKNLYFNAFEDASPASPASPNLEKNNK